VRPTPRETRTDSTVCDLVRGRNIHGHPAVESGVNIGQVQDVLVAVAPITGAPRVLAAARTITEALGMAIAITEIAEADAEARAEA
jgi:hypothetical protein